MLGLAQVSDYVLKEAAYLIDRMLENRSDVRAAMVKNKVRFAVLAVSERTTDIPEHSDLKPAAYWNRCARGLGATPVRPAVSCGEENLLNYLGDPYATENILVHEFGHAIHEMGLNAVDPAFDDRLKTIYKAALAQGLWNGKYAAPSPHEYWAEGVKSYFDTNHDHNHVNTHEELAEYDPDLYRLIDEAFRKSTWRYQRPAGAAPKRGAPGQVRPKPGPKIRLGTRAGEGVPEGLGRARARRKPPARGPIRDERSGGNPGNPHHSPSGS